MFKLNSPTSAFDGEAVMLLSTFLSPAFDGDNALGTVDPDEVELFVAVLMLLSNSSFSASDGDNAMGNVASDEVELSVAPVMLRSKSSPWVLMSVSYARTYPR